MALRRIIPWPDKRLRTAADPVASVDDDLRTLWDDMLDTMYAMPGVGLAAPQIGVILRVCVVDGAGDGKAPLRMANPEIIDASLKTRDHEEASPNLPGVSATLARPRGVSVRYLDETGTIARRDLVGVWATSVQHQIDHLNGRMFFDNLSPLKRRMILAKAKKRARA
ncbi:MAG: peptide deformylase [Pseudomonadota bacterium]